MSYRQYCGIARALDLVGDRWTLLIVRELLAGGSRYRELQAGLPGIATNLLASRLRRLESDGLVTREGNEYVLTARGTELRPVLRELVRWAEPLMVDGPQGDHFDGGWLVVALEALLRPSAGGRVNLRSGGADLHVVADASGTTIGRGRVVGADASVEADGHAVLGVATGRLSLRDGIERGVVAVDGDVGVAEAVLAGVPSLG